ncbi:hypothetical protein [Chryseobacterium sp. SIMBA_038]|uniref:hypothetical protein n=1 Tax=Chryseobacterium sp. SIMBA_038 TaxID=3085780 RepID=UPI00397C44D8
MKKLLLTSLLGLALLLPASFSASTSGTTSTTEFSAKKPKKSKSSRKKSRKSKTRSSRSSYSQSKGCTYNGHSLYVGERGGCYYMAGNSKEYVDRSYCSGCN